MANNALAFDGASGYVACGTADPSTGPLTMGCWINWAGTPNGANSSQVFMSKHTIFASNKRWWWGWDKTSNRVIIYGDGAIFPQWTYTPPIGTVTHLTWVHDTVNSLDKLYVNGSFHSSFSSITLGGQAGAALQIGASSGGTAEYFKGTIDGVFINSGTLSASQISNIYNGTDPNTLSGAWATWHFDEGTGTTTADVTGAHTGTLSGGTIPTWVAGIEPNPPSAFRPRSLSMLGIG